MKLSELLNHVKAIQVTGEFLRKDISGIFYDSRQVISSSIFVAIKGYNSDGHKYIPEAINKGAIAVVLEDNAVYPEEFFTHQMVTKILVKDSRIALADLSNAYYDNPSEKLKLVGITGTNGKTTTTYFIKSIIEQNKEKTGLFGTIANFIGDRKLASSLTTPESNDLSHYMMDMVREDCKYCVMEVSSHSLSLGRVHGQKFLAGVLTNITSDHLDFHKTFEGYRDAKKVLFNALTEDSVAIINSDDASAEYIANGCKAKIITYGKSSGSDFLIKDINYDLNGTSFVINHNNKNYKVNTKLIGAFNAYNAAAAFAVGVSLGIEESVIISGIKNTPQVPGRFEVIGSGKKKVIVDYSHTADSLEKALTTIRGIMRDKIPLYTVFGCGGNRDKTKRPVMGKIAGENSSKTFVTSDNPRDEEPLAIIENIKTGMAIYNYSVIEDREEAIKTAIAESGEEAVILIAGKGHETYQEIKGIRNHFSDKEIAEKYLAL
jgi:UDP-N-acetylmuramoyl-L-alanyl-D-glutamate--2,6-diaminopimelate ligase